MIHCNDAGAERSICSVLSLMASPHGSAALPKNLHPPASTLARRQLCLKLGGLLFRNPAGASLPLHHVRGSARIVDPLSTGLAEGLERDEMTFRIAVDSEESEETPSPR